MIENEKDYMAHKKEWADLNIYILDYREDEHGWHKLYEWRNRRGFLEALMSRYDQKHHSDRKGIWMPLFYGTRVWPEDPRPEDFDIRDIAHSLARINRFNGHTKRGYSVAQHSVHVAELLTKKTALFGLMHDAGEAILCDVITPVKNLIRVMYEPMEEAVMQAISKKFLFNKSYNNPEHIKLVKAADEKMLATEVRDLTKNGFVVTKLNQIPRKEEIIYCWDNQEAEERFLEKFKELTNGRTKDR